MVKAAQLRLSWRMVRAIQNTHPATILAFCGLLTAGVNLFGLAKFDDFVLYWPGVIFGFPVAGYLALLGIPLWRCAAVWGAFVASWSAALFTGLYLGGNIGLDFFPIGLICGAIGILLVIIGFAIALPRYRDWRIMMVPIVVGVVAGAIVLVLIDHAEWPLFVIWQTAVGAALGWKPEVFDRESKAVT